MIKCKEIVSGDVKIPACGKDCCCKYCDDLHTCPDACEDAIDTKERCPDEMEEVDGLTLFQSKEISIIQAMTDLLKQKKELEKQEKTVREQLVAAMDAYGVKSFENDLLKVTYIAPTSKTTIDSKALKKEMPDVAAKYSKTSPVAASVRIALK